MQQELTGAEILIECLKEQGVDTIFGYPGGAVLNIYDELYKHQSEIKHILTSHEQGASHAADGYARATGKVGVCLATSGPGATNIVTGIATAYMDSIPMVAITGNVGVGLLGKDSFQEVDIKGVTMPITKHNFIVKDVAELAVTLRRAFYIAKEGRPGPVLVDIPKDVTANQAMYKYETPKTVERVTTNVKEEDIKKAVKTISKSKKPYILIGGGAISSDASDEIRRFAELIQAPVCDTLMGKGAFDGNHANYTGMLGMHGTKTSNIGVTKSDVLIVIGARFSDRVFGNPKRFARDAQIIHIDVDPAEIDKNIISYSSVIGDIKAVLSILNKSLMQVEMPNKAKWLEEVHGMKEKFPLRYADGRMSGPQIVEKIYEVTKGNAIISTEVGQHQMWAAQFYRYSRPRQLLTSGGLGTMGYGLGASIGAKMACPDQTVINIAGDGCFRMNLNEIATASRYNIPIIQVVLNNHVLGMVHQWQTFFYESRYAYTQFTDKVDFVKVSEGLGAKAFRVTTIEEFEETLKKAMEMNEPVVIDCQIMSDDKVFPMAPAGQPIEEAFDENDLPN